MTNLPQLAPDAGQSILYVDDEAQACKWFERSFRDEFDICTASGVEEALAILRDRNDEFAVVVTDYSMPGANGVKLLQAMQHLHRHLVPILASAYADKDVAISAINEGNVFRILEKPLDAQAVRIALREGLALHATRAQERALNENRALGMREILGFLAHELNTPLTTVRGYMGALQDRHEAVAPPSPMVVTRVNFIEYREGEVLAALQSAERSAMHCQSLLATFVQSARDAYPGATEQTFTASSLVDALLDEYPFEGEQRGWLVPRIETDFVLPGRRDLLYLVLCTLTKNAVQALAHTPQPRIRLEIGRGTPAHGGERPVLRLIDNGPGIAPEVLAKLTLEPTTTRSANGGNGMGLIFCRRIVQSVSGSIEIASELGEGTTVSLFFPFISEAAVPAR